jgi:hypothetical protein
MADDYRSLQQQESIHAFASVRCAGVQRFKLDYQLPSMKE